MGGNNLCFVQTDRTAILWRLLYSLVCLLAFEIMKILVQLTVLVQYLLLLTVKGYSPALRGWSNNLSAYAYRLIRYLSLTENQPPFPFAAFPERLETIEDQVRFPGDGGSS
jgi:hypothetical protein